MTNNGHYNGIAVAGLDRNDLGNQAARFFRERGMSVIGITFERDTSPFDKTHTHYHLVPYDRSSFTAQTLVDGCEPVADGTTDFGGLKSKIDALTGISLPQRIVIVEPTNNQFQIYTDNFNVNGAYKRKVYSPGSVGDAHLESVRHVLKHRPKGTAR